MPSQYQQPLSRSSSFKEDTLWNVPNQQQDQKNSEHDFNNFDDNAVWGNTMRRQMSQPFLTHHQQNKRNNFSESPNLQLSTNTNDASCMRSSLDQNVKNVAIKMVETENLSDHLSQEVIKEQKQYFPPPPPIQEIQMKKERKSKWGDAVVATKPYMQTLYQQSQEEQQQQPSLVPQVQIIQEHQEQQIIDFPEQNNNPHNDPLIDQILSLKLQPPQYITYQSFSPTPQHFTTSKRNYELLIGQKLRQQDIKPFSPNPSQFNEKSYFSDLNFSQRQQSFSGQMHQFEEIEQIESASILKQLKLPKSEVIFKVLEKNNNSYKNNTDARMLHTEYDQIQKIRQQFRKQIERQQEILQRDRKSVQTNPSRRIIEPLYNSTKLKGDSQNQIQEHIPSLTVLPSIGKKFSHQQGVTQLLKEKSRIRKEIQDIQIKQLGTELELMKLQNNHDFETKLEEIKFQLGEYVEF